MNIKFHGKTHGYLSVWLGLGMTCLMSCGKKDKDEPAAVNYATLALANAATSTDNGPVNLTSVVACNKDVVSGFLNVELTSPSGTLSVKIRDFKSTPAVYVCKQALDNNVNAGSVGSRYDTCGVEVQTLA